MAINFGILNPNLPAEIAGAPMQGYQNMLALRRQQENDVRSNRLAALQEQQLTGQLTDAETARQNAIAQRQAYAQGAGNVPKTAQALMGAGFGKEGMSLLAEERKSRKDMLDAAKNQIEVAKQTMTAVMGNPSQQTAMMALGKYQTMTGDDISGDIAELNALGGDPERIRQWAASKALDASKLEYQFRDIGVGKDQVQTAAIDPITLQPILIGKPKAAFAPPTSITLGSDIIEGQGGALYRAPKSGAPAKPIVTEKGEPIKKPSAEKISSAAEKELFDINDGIQKAGEALSTFNEMKRLAPKAYEGVLATSRATVESQLGGNERANATKEYDRLVKSVSLDNLKIIFGGNPTEGERAASELIQAQTAGTLEQKKTAIDALMNRVQNQITYNKQKAESIASGSLKSTGLVDTQTPNIIDFNSLPKRK